MAFSGEFEFANQQSQFRQGGKSNSTRNAYKIIVILITRAKVMVLWSLTKNQSKFFLKLSTQTIPTAPAFFRITFNVLEVGVKISIQNKHHSYENKNLEKSKKNHKKLLLKCRKWHFLKNLSLQTGRASFTKEGNQIPPEMHIK